MSALIKRTTVTDGKPTVCYYMQMTVFGPMFQSKDLAKHFASADEARECIEEEELEQLDGWLEIVEE